MKKAKYQKIDVEIYSFAKDGNGGIGCLSKNCSYKSECANHCSAGDFRSEDGFTPKLKVKEGQFFCGTFWKDPLTSYTAQHLPENYDEMDRGMLIFEDGKIKLSESF